MIPVRGDLYNFDACWAKKFVEHKCQYYEIYDMEDCIVNYPPIYPTYLYIFRNIIVNNTIYIENSNKIYGLLALPKNHISFLILHLYEYMALCIILVWIYKTKEYKFGALFLLSPVTILVSGYWSQHDMLFTFLIFLLWRSLEQHRYNLVAFIMGVELLLKPQGLMLAFPYAVFLLYDFYVKKIDLKRLVKTYLITFMIFCIGWLPFIIHYKSFWKIIEINLGFSGHDWGNVHGSGVSIWSWTKIFKDIIILNNNIMLNIMNYILLMICCLIFICMLNKLKNNKNVKK